MQAKMVNLCCRATLLLFLVVAISPIMPVRAQSDPVDTDEQKPIEQPGYLVPFEQVDVYARITGYVGEIAVDLGDRVKKGQLLARLAVPELERKREKTEAMVSKARISVEQAKRAARVLAAAVERSKAEMEEAKIALVKFQALAKRWAAEDERMKLLQSDGKTHLDHQTVVEVARQAEATKAAEQEAKAKVKTAETVQIVAAARRDKGDTDVDLAQANLQAAKAEAAQVFNLLQYTELRASFDGVVIRRNANIGTLAGPPSSARSEPLFTVARIDPVRVIVLVPENDAVRVVKGMAATIHLEAFKGQDFKGTVARTAWALDRKTRTLHVEIDLPNPEGRLLPGMYASVILTPKTAEPKKKQ